MFFKLINSASFKMKNVANGSYDVANGDPKGRGRISKEGVK